MELPLDLESHSALTPSPRRHNENPQSLDPTPLPSHGDPLWDILCFICSFFSYSHLKIAICKSYLDRETWFRIWLCAKLLVSSWSGSMAASTPLLLPLCAVSLLVYCTQWAPLVTKIVRDFWTIYCNSLSHQYLPMGSSCHMIDIVRYFWLFCAREFNQLSHYRIW